MRITIFRLPLAVKNILISLLKNYIPMSKADRTHEVGFVIRTKRYLLAIEGLPSARVNDLLVDEQGNLAIVRSLADDHISALALGSVAGPGDRYTYLKEDYMYSCGEQLFGRIINTLGVPVDGKGALPPGEVPLALEQDAPGIEQRVAIHEQLQTGVTLIDLMIPIAKGQRQLLFGPMRSGKTTFLTETVLSQVPHGTVCIYVVLGKPVAGLRKVTDTILADKKQGKNIVIAALSDEPASLIALAPSVAFLLAEYYRSQGEDVLVILDDLDAHAKYLREIALLEGRLPSNESYPGDIFYQHAHLMERSGHFNESLGGGSITALPVVQTDLKNFSDLIPTNLMACTDGHFSFVPDLRAEGIYPSISIEQSVTRVGRQAQATMQKQLTTRIQILLGSYRQQKEYAQFSADLNAHTKDTLRRGAIAEVLLQQQPYMSVPRSTQVLLLGLMFTNFFDEHDSTFAKQHKAAIAQALITDDRFSELRSQSLETVAYEDFIHDLQSHTDFLHSVCQP
jgi:F-type H+-transporting ATPase subunit alpha